MYTTACRFTYVGGPDNGVILETDGGELGPSSYVAFLWLATEEATLGKGVRGVSQADLAYLAGYVERARAGLRERSADEMQVSKYVVTSRSVDPDGKVIAEMSLVPDQPADTSR